MDKKYPRGEWTRFLYVTAVGNLENDMPNLGKKDKDMVSFSNDSFCWIEVQDFQPWKLPLREKM